MRGRNRRRCSSVPHRNSVLPTILIPKLSCGAPVGTPARANSSASTTCSSLVRPPPPYSRGHATPRNPCSWRHLRHASASSASGACSSRNLRTRSRKSATSGRAEQCFRVAPHDLVLVVLRQGRQQLGEV